MSLQQISARRLPIAFLAALAFAAGAVFAISGGFADGAKNKVIGKPKGNVPQQCAAKDNKPGDENASCTVMASTTAVQVIADGKRNAAKAPANGRIVAYGTSLGKPQKSFRDQLAEMFPGGAFEGKATTQLAILRSEKKGRFKLLRKSEDFKVSGYLNQDPIAVLDTPLRVRKGDFIGLTTPSWLPALGARSNKTRWRGSQTSPSREKCSDPEVLEKSKPLRKEGKSRRFLCAYDDYVLYWAYFQPAKKGGNGGGGGGNKTQVLGDAPASAPSGGRVGSGGITP